MLEVGQYYSIGGKLESDKSYCKIYTEMDQQMIDRMAPTTCYRTWICQHTSTNNCTSSTQFTQN